MAVKLITPPETEPLEIEEAKLHLKVETDDDDTSITALIMAAREYCEGFQRRAYITQTYELWLEEFPGKDYIELPMPPLQSVESIVYYEIGEDTGIEFEDYFVVTEGEPGKVVLNYGESWPPVTLRPVKGVCITFVAGYGDDAEDVPAKVKQAMLLLIGAWYENREAYATTGAVPKEIPFAVDALLWMDRCF